MTSFDDRMVPLSLRLLERYGKDATFGRVTVGSYSPETGAVTKTVATSDVKVYIDTPTTAELAQGVVEASDMVYLLAGSALLLAPSVNDEITYDSVKTVVKRVLPVWSGESVALYRLVARR